MHVVPIKHPNTNTRDAMMSNSQGTVIPRWQVQATLCIKKYIYCLYKNLGKSALGIYLTIFEVWRVQCLTCRCALITARQCLHIVLFVCPLHFLLSHFLTQILSHLKLAGTFAISQTLWLGSLSPFCSFRHFCSTTKSVKVQRIVGTHGPQVTVVPTSLRFVLLQLKR